MPTARRVGAETSKTRLRLLDAAERLMAKEGYAAVTYRSVARKAGVTFGLVQYYFPTMDDLFVAILERRGRESLERLVASLESNPEDTLRVVWESAADDLGANLTVEFMALANHRKSIKSQILQVTKQIRQAQLDALVRQWDDLTLPVDGLTAEGLLFLLHAIPKMAKLETSIGLRSGHQEVLALVQERVIGAGGVRRR